MQDDCPLCENIAQSALKKESRLIHEFEHSCLLFGAHQFYPGYCVLIAKNHARELHLLSPEIRNAIWEELMQAGSAIAEVFKPWKLNYASYGNQVEHIHWHIFPRYAEDPMRRECPFFNAARFTDYPTKLDQLTHVYEQLRSILSA